VRDAEQPRGSRDGDGGHVEQRVDEDAGQRRGAGGRDPGAVAVAEVVQPLGPRDRVATAGGPLCRQPLARTALWRQVR
jgi:hypothetical protein